MKINQEWIKHTILSWYEDPDTAAELIWKNILIEFNRLREENDKFRKTLENLDKYNHNLSDKDRAENSYEYIAYTINEVLNNE